MEALSPNNRFPKAEKIKSRRQTEALFASGKRFNAYPLKVVYLMTPAKEIPPAYVQAGVGVSSRQVKLAARRNRIKRLMREAYRLHKHELLTMAQTKGVHLTVFFICADQNINDYRIIAEKMQYCLRRLCNYVSASLPE